ncbi:MAG TPA: hypothetical protein VF407_11150, partial [Polyangiaceae bacterium]
MASASRLLTCALFGAGALFFAACGGDSADDSAAPGGNGSDGGAGVLGDGGSTLADGATPNGEGGIGADGGPTICTTTRITYGNAWIHAASHADQFDDVDGLVTWDGKCTPDGANSYALLSNGFKPYFTGHDSCVIATDTKGSCAGLAPKCTTRIAYGDSWSAPAGHTNRYDDVDGRVFASGSCVNAGGSSHELLSNGFDPYFTGNGACSLSLSYAQCGGLYQNPVNAIDCPDP